MEKVTIIPQDESVGLKICTYQYTEGSKKVQPKERVETLASLYNVGTVGTLSRYKDTKKQDIFGRKGGGEVIQCRVAKIIGISKSKLTVKFATYERKYFTTKLSYSMENDGDELDGLAREVVEIPIEQLGFDKYIGSLYYFNLPIQYAKKDCETIYIEQADGTVAMKQLSLPEFIKVVLDEHDEKYDSVALLECIIKTNKYLKGRELEDK
jgi:hypothetical protein